MIEKQLERRGKAVAAAMFDLHVLAGEDNWQMLLHVQVYSTSYVNKATDVNATIFTSEESHHTCSMHKHIPLRSFFT